MAQADVDRLVIEALADERAEFEEDYVLAMRDAVSYRLLLLTSLAMLLECQEENRTLHRRLKAANDQILQLMNIDPPRDDDGR